MDDLVIAKRGLHREGGRILIARLPYMTFVMTSPQCQIPDRLVRVHASFDHWNFSSTAYQHSLPCGWAENIQNTKARGLRLGYMMKFVSPPGTRGRNCSLMQEPRSEVRGPMPTPMPADHGVISRGLWMWPEHRIIAEAVQERVQVCQRSGPIRAGGRSRCWS